MTAEKRRHTYHVILTGVKTSLNKTVEADHVSTGSKAVTFFLGDEPVAEFQLATLIGWMRVPD